MKKILCFALLLYFTTKSFGQGASYQKFEIQYQNSMFISLDTFGISEFPVTIDYSVVGTQDSSRIVSVESAETEDNVSIQIKTPQNTNFNGKVWSSTTDGVRSISPFLIKDILVTTEEKYILGYRCQKLIGKSVTNGSDIFIWICKDLPETLMPGCGSPPMGGAILELSLPAFKTHIVATSVKKIFDIPLK